MKVLGFMVVKCLVSTIVLSVCRSRGGDSSSSMGGVPCRWAGGIVSLPSLSLCPCLLGHHPYSDHNTGREVEPGSRWLWVGVGRDADLECKLQAGLATLGNSVSTALPLGLSSCLGHDSQGCTMRA